jgi:hypothetical protein
MKYLHVADHARQDEPTPLRGLMAGGLEPRLGARHRLRRMPPMVSHRYKPLFGDSPRRTNRWSMHFW